MNPKNEIHEELRALSPFLASLPKINPFKVPSSYFEELEFDMLQTIKNSKEEEIIFGSRENIFEIPDGYFRQLPSTILSELHKQNERNGTIRRGRIIPVFSNYKGWLAAASVALIVTVSAAILKTQQTAYVTSEIAPPAMEISPLYVLEDASDMDEALIVELYVQDQRQQEKEGTFGNESLYLTEVTDIDPENMN